jgi:hypothetical protein
MDICDVCKCDKDLANYAACPICGELSESPVLVGSVTKPPIGLKPKKIHDEQRYLEVCAAIARYYNAGMKIPLEWVREHNSFVD